MKKLYAALLVTACFVLSVFVYGCDIDISGGGESSEISETVSETVSVPDVSEEVSVPEASEDISQPLPEESVIPEVSEEESLLPEVSEDISIPEEVSGQVSEELTDRTATVTNPATGKGITYTGLPALMQIEYTVKDADNLRGLDTKRQDFSYGVAKDGKPHNVTVNNQKRFDDYGTNALAWDNKTEEKVLYLTFDCGYKYEDLVTRILDTLDEKDVPAAFFCTVDYLKTAPDDVARMLADGHIVGNHSTTHPSDCSLLTREKMAWELLGVENYLRENFGYTSKYFRFPCGVYSESALETVDSVGYRSVFWSIAHADWDPANQPGEEVSFNTVTSRLHPGAVILLHSTSPDNAAILGKFIDYCTEQGYTFRSLDEYEYWN